MTRGQAAAFVEALDRYLEAREASTDVDPITTGAGEISLLVRHENQVREQLIDTLADEERTKPLAGNDRGKR